MPPRRRQKTEGDFLFFCLFFYSHFPPSQKKGVEQNYEKLRAVVLNVLNMRICYIALLAWSKSQQILNKEILISFFLLHLRFSIKQTIATLGACQ